MGDHGAQDAGASPTGERPLVVIGYAPGLLAAMAKIQPDRPMVVIEDPGVVLRRGARKVVAGMAAVRELIEWDYQASGAADAFHNRYPDLRPAAVIPIPEYSVPFVARLAERYRVVGAGYGAALVLRDKRLTRGVTAAAGVPNPESVEVSDPAEVKAFMAEVAGSVVLKPANRRCSVGTKLLHDVADVDAAWRECLDQDEGVFAPGRPMPLVMLAERCVRGAEYSVEMMVSAGRPLFGGVTKKFLFPGPRPVEQGHVHPADIDQELTDRLLADTRTVIDAVGLDSGFVHCEWIVEDGVPHLVECAGRMSGDWILDLIKLAWEFDPVERYVTMMTGVPVELPAKASGAAAIWMTAPSEVGVVESTAGVPEANAVDGVQEVIVIAVGERTNELRSSWDRTSGVIAEAATAPEALDRAKRAIEHLTIKVRPEPRP